MNDFEVARLYDVEPMFENEWVAWWPLRREFGIRAFGANVWIGRREGDEVIGEHDEAQERHEELYVVLRGRAAFTVGGDEVDAPAGTAVFVRPGTSRIAVARESDTRILGIGAKAGAAFEPTPWERRYTGEL